MSDDVREPDAYDMSELIDKLSKLANKTIRPDDDEDFCIIDACGSNFDDAYDIGIKHGEVYLARELLAIAKDEDSKLRTYDKAVAFTKPLYVVPTYTDHGDHGQEMNGIALSIYEDDETDAVCWVTCDTGDGTRIEECARELAKRWNEYHKLRKIMSYIPARIVIEAQEKAGFGNAIKLMGGE